MAIAILPYTEQWVPAVEAFNHRLAGGGVAREFRFPERHVPAWLPALPGRRIYQELYLATENDDVRGAYILKVQPFDVGGRDLTIGYYHLPISEGIVSRSYSTVGVQMLRSALKAQPLLFCLGMGGFDRPLPQMLKALGWRLSAVPFYFKVIRPATFLRNISPLRETMGRRMLASAAAATGIGWIGVNAIQRARTRRSDPSVGAEAIDEFGPWADALWERTRGGYRFIAARDRETLNILYPRDKPFLRLRVQRAGETVGLAVVLDTKMDGHKYFGDMRVGSIVDCCAAAGDAPAVVQAATAFLAARAVDLVVTNQSHRAWTRALSDRGFLQGPSNFIFAASKPLAELLEPFEENRHEIHLTRGDGDGPVNL